MKASILSTLVCPVTRSPLDLDCRVRESDEILEGFLISREGARYPIIGGVPRMLPPHLRGQLAEDYPEFYRRYAGELGQSASHGSVQAAVQRHTQSSFGYEWTWAADYDPGNFADWIPDGFTIEKLFSGRRGLEIGCGAGRHARETAALADEHFAADLSRAVDAAFANTRDRPNCHVVQADAFHMPFREGEFDYVYCLGVLQHFHDPPAGFRAIAKLPRPEGILLANVYQLSRPVMIGLLSAVRRCTTRMSNPTLRRLSEVAGRLEYGIFIRSWRAIKPTVAGKLIAPIVPQRLDEYTKHDLHTCIVDWFDRLSCPVKLHYKREDLVAWFRAAGYTDVVVTPYWKAFWNGYGRRDPTGAAATEPNRIRSEDTIVQDNDRTRPMPHSEKVTVARDTLPPSAR
jgi:SAM-dependent methyltransferase